MRLWSLQKVWRTSNKSIIFLTTLNIKSNSRKPLISFMFVSLGKISCKVNQKITSVWENLFLHPPILEYHYQRIRKFWLKKLIICCVMDRGFPRFLMLSSVHINVSNLNLRMRFVKSAVTFGQILWAQIGQSNE